MRFAVVRILPPPSSYRWLKPDLFILRNSLSLPFLLRIQSDISASFLGRFFFQKTKLADVIDSKFCSPAMAWKESLPGMPPAVGLTCLPAEGQSMAQVFCLSCGRAAIPTLLSGGRNQAEKAASWEEKQHQICVTWIPQGEMEMENLPLFFFFHLLFVILILFACLI